MKKHLFLASVALTLAAGNLNAAGDNNNEASEAKLADSTIQDMKRQHKVMTQGA